MITGEIERAPLDDTWMLDRMLDGDENAVQTLVARHHAALLGVARLFVSSPSAAEELARDTWLAILRGADRFDQSSSMRTWMFRILIDQARNQEEPGRGRSAVANLHHHAAESEPAVDPTHFHGPGHRWAGHWATPPRPVNDVANGRPVSTETGERVRCVLDALPPDQRRVVTLRDVYGLSSTEVCELLRLTEPTQRALLHRARSRVRAAFESYMDAR